MSPSFALLSCFAAADVIHHVVPDAGVVDLEHRRSDVGGRESRSGPGELSVEPCRSSGSRHSIVFSTLSASQRQVIVLSVLIVHCLQAPFPERRRRSGGSEARLVEVSSGPSSGRRPRSAP